MRERERERERKKLLNKGRKGSEEGRWWLPGDRN